MPNADASPNRWPKSSAKGGIELDLQPLQTAALFPAPDSSRARAHLLSFLYPWEVLPTLKAYLWNIGAALDREEFEERGEGIWISRRAKVTESVSLQAPCIIEEGAELRHGAFLRGGVLVGRGAVVGNSCELKNCLLSDGVQVPHFNYVGDSVLGFRAHLGAGAVTSNVKGDRSEVSIRFGEKRLPTGMKKLGAILGDGVEIGCNAVLNPGTVIGVGTRVYPLSSVRGYLPAHAICKAERGVFLQHEKG